MLRLGLGIAAAIFAGDRFTKWLILDVWGLGDRIYEVAPFFNIVTVWNTGVSFGMLQSQSSAAPLLLSGLALAIVVALVVWLKRAENRFMAFALGLVIGGALGNTFDRLTFGAVFDFLDFHVSGYHWPAFNVADSAIVVGVIALLYDGLLRARPGSKQA
jgi:signal peptidase II